MPSPLLRLPRRDVSKGKVKATFDMASSGVTEASPATQTVNPPYVHSVTFSKSGTTFAAGVGDGSIVIHDASTQRCVQRMWPHTRAVGRVEYPAFLLDSHLANSVVVSSGNDGKVLVLDVRSDDPESTAAARKASKSKRKGKKAAGVSAVSTETSASASDAAAAAAAPASKVLYRIDHGSGPNWMTTSSACGGCIIVADTTPTVTVYCNVAEPVLARLGAAATSGALEVAVSTDVLATADAK